MLYVFLHTRITADFEAYAAVSGAGSLILSKTCRGNKALDEMLFDQHFVSALSFQQVICIISEMFVLLCPLLKLLYQAA